MGFKKWRSHFRVPPGLRIKTRLNAMPLIWNDIYRVFFILMQIKLIFTRKVVHLVFGTRKRPISHWRIPTGKPGLPFQTFRCSRKFATEMTRKVMFIYQCRTLASLRGRRSKGKGKGIRARDRARGRREEVPFLSPSRVPSALPHPNSRFPF